MPFLLLAFRNGVAKRRCAPTYGDGHARDVQWLLFDLPVPGDPRGLRGTADRVAERHVRLDVENRTAGRSEKKEARRGLGAMEIVSIFFGGFSVGFDFESSDSFCVPLPSVDEVDA